MEYWRWGRRECGVVSELWFVFFFFKQKTAYEMCGRDWSSDVCSSDLTVHPLPTPKSPNYLVWITLVLHSPIYCYVFLVLDRKSVV